MFLLLILGPSIEISESLPLESHLSKSQSDSRIVCHSQMHEDGRSGLGESTNEDGRLTGYRNSYNLNGIMH